jgi:2-phosphosulfolactate phosphatase
MKTVEVLFTPAEFGALCGRDLSGTVCVVFDVFRATTSMVTALANGAAAVIPALDIAEALELRRRYPEALLAGERNGLRISAAQACGVEFDLGNSPREFTPERVANRIIVTTTTNGTRAIRACLGAGSVLVGSFLNLAATAQAVRRTSCDTLLVVCSGTLEQAAYEDTLGAGALCDLLWDGFDPAGVADSALMARQIFQRAPADPLSAANLSRNGRRLLRMPELKDDVVFSLERDRVPFAATLDQQGRVIRL